MREVYVLSKERFKDFLGQAKRALVAAQSEAEGLNISRDVVFAISDHLTSAICSATAAGTIFATNEAPLSTRDEIEDAIRERQEGKRPRPY